MVNLIKRCTNSLVELWIWLFGVLLIAAGLFAVFEDVNYWQAFYWACVTATSTGYGDISPKTVPGQILAIALMFTSLFFILPLMISHVINTCMENPDHFSDAEQKRLLGSVDIILETVTNKPERKSNRTRTLPFKIMDRDSLAESLWYITSRNVLGGEFYKGAKPEDSPAMRDVFALADETIAKIDAARVL